MAFAALKAQSAVTKAGDGLDRHYKALQGMADNEPWTSRIIRAARLDGSAVDFEKLDDEWLQQLALRLPESVFNEL